MKIKLGETTIDIISMTWTSNTLRIKVSETDDSQRFSSQLFNHSSLIYMDDDNNVLRTFDGKFTLNSVEQSDGFMFYNLQMPTESEKAMSKVTMINDVITNIELALCEIYESLGV